MFNITDLTCRVCLQEKQVLINIFEELEELQTTLCKLLETCGGLQIENEDEFPKYLCEECTGELLIAAKFKDKCAKSNETLKNSQRIVNHEEDDGRKLSDFFEIIDYCTEDNVKDDIKEDSNLCFMPNALENIKQEECDIKNFIQNESYIDNNEAFSSMLIKETEEEIKEKSISDCQPVVSEIEDNVEKQFVISVADPTMPILSPKTQNKRSYKCDICGAAFVQVINLQKHLLKNHSIEQCYVCSVCDHCFTKELELIKHEEDCKQTEIHTTKKKDNKANATIEQLENARKCTYCDREFQTPFAMRMHLRVHTGERPYNCHHCEKGFKTRSSLNVHIKRHIGQADFVCNVCHKYFYEQGNLDVHMRSHTGERPHQCAVCQKSFSRVFLLELHMRIHTGEKPFTCSYCERSFRQRTDWKYHLSTHTGMKQHKCKWCAKAYIKKALLVQHVQSQHAVSMEQLSDHVSKGKDEDAANKEDSYFIEYKIDTENESG